MNVEDRQALLDQIKGRKVYVTGAGGFIGSHLVERLVELGAEVRALVHYNALGRAGWLDYSPVRREVEILAGDTCDRDSVRETMRGAELVFHLAALIGIPYSYRTPKSYVRTNVEGTLHVLLGAREHDVERMVHTSTSEVYGTARYVPIDEKHPLVGQSPYAASKIGADKIAEAFHMSFGVPVATVRPFNTFGPRQSARAIIPTIVTQLLRGDQVTLGNTQPTRDLNYVANTVEGYVLAAVAPDAIGQTMNLGSGREISIGDLAHLIAERMGREIEIEHDDARMRPAGGEVDRLLANSALAGEIMGWEPLYSLEEGLDRTIAWIRENADWYKPGEYVV